ncbi:hypothetical protein I317_05057 [Kwoniella heveanensis CBS 569]|uniref:Transcription factor domain-containing protein n=1 Tax=Kwoniella heveanensis BCC8398 TaxID=1296120 RepID=A0A1B9GIF6_9TREE|nr:hypothetical protein I316_07487 [Kwoniella heveanensis BCC8398]OCF41143.1 hypothetical protein I317_05057 [Kwoniella heveanensis CBS 569]
MIALGSLALQNKDVQSRATSLWKLVNRNITTSWEQLIENQGRYDPCKGTNLIQTVVTGLLFASASADPSVLNQACMTLANGLHWARIAGILTPEVINQNLLPKLDQPVTPLQLDMRWRQWTVLEDLKRAISTIYLLDPTLALATESSCIARHLDNPCGCVWDDEPSYAALNAEQWKNSIDRCRSSFAPLNNLSIADLYQYLFSDDPSWDTDLTTVGMMARQALLAGLASLIIDANQSHHGSFDLARRDLGSIGRALLRYYDIFIHRTDDSRSLSVLVGHWHHTAILFGYAIAKQQRLARQSIWTLPLGRHLLLHANAIRHFFESFQLGRAKVPHFIQVQILQSAAFVFRDYVAYSSSKPSDDPSQIFVGRYSLNLEVDWASLNRTTGLVYSAMPVDAGSHGAPDVASLLREEAFIKVNNIVPVINGFSSLGNQDLGPFITILYGLGRTHPRAGEIAVQLEQSARII